MEERNACNAQRSFIWVMHVVKGPHCRRGVWMEEAEVIDNPVVVIGQGSLVKVE